MFKVLIVDDEFMVRAALMEMIAEHCLAVSEMAEAESVADGLSKIKSFQPDIVCLDISLGDGTGFDLLEKAQPIGFAFIFLTAYGEYAIDAFKVNAVDYLLKPPSPQELTDAFEKCAKQVTTEREKMASQEGPSDSSKIVLKTADSFFLVSPKDVLFCESDAGYTTFYLKDKRKILVSKNLKSIEESLPQSHLIRVHKSFLVNPTYITAFHKGKTTYIELVDGSKVPVAIRKRDELLLFLNRFQNI